MCVLIDVEEEFDWESGFDPGQRRVGHLSRLPELLDLLSARDLSPVGVCTYPVVEDPRAVDLLGPEIASGRMQLGTHLHPWVCPPHDAVVSDRNSFPGNLPREQEAAKLAALTEGLEQAFGTRPRVYQAGRYGLGPHSRSTLEEQGYDVDMSVSPPFDYRAEGGPDFRFASNAPHWFGEQRQLLSLPVSGGFVGWGSRFGPGLYNMATRPGLRALRLPAILSRTSAVERIRLSPEGHDAADMLRLARAMIRRGEQVLSMSFHSPSLEPGCTSYVNTEVERRDFLSRIARFIDSFVEELGGEVSTPMGLFAELRDQSPARSSGLPNAR
ncbi:MAG: hypothetical protein DHS20C15_14380 [Planctomycetota bacterium]|nr:MAG: hypothetical protein DHS20C15_14380 [Planctomycetota bacterium]